MSEKNYADALGTAKAKFSKADPLIMAAKSDAPFEQVGEGRGFFTLRYLNKDYRVDYPEGKASFADSDAVQKEDLKKIGCGRPILNNGDIDYSGETILISDKTLILMYLKRASGLPPREEWINFMQLPEGAHHHGPFHVDAINPMTKMFAEEKELFFEAAKKLGGEQAKLGDFGAIIPIFPKVPLAFMIWEGDEEFPAKGNILFDKTVTTYLDTAGAYVMGINAARRLISVAERLLK